MEQPMIKHLKNFRLYILMVAAFCGAAMPSWALPNLQIYLPQGTYDTETETWVVPAYDYDLWVIGARQNIFDVRIVFAVPEDESGSIQLRWLDPGAADYGTSAITSLVMTEGSAMAYDDYRQAQAAGQQDPLTYGYGITGAPLMGNGKSIPPHGVFPSGFYEYGIGDFVPDPFDAAGNPVYNYIPGDEYGDTASGQVKMFHVTVDGYSTVHIIAYGDVIMPGGKIKSVFTPFSHDGEDGERIPEPAILILLGCGLTGLWQFKKTCRP